MNYSEFLSTWLATPLSAPDLQGVFNRYYRSYLKNFTTLTRYYLDRKFDRATSIIRERGVGHLLDVGTGCGTEALYFAQTCNIRVTSIDVGELFLRIAEMRKEQLESLIGSRLPVRFQLCDINNMSTEEKFDMVWMHETFHHLEPRENAVRMVSNLLRDGGHVLVIENNALNPLIQLALFRRRGLKLYIKYYDDNGNICYWGQERILRAKKLAKIMKRYDIHEVERSYFRIFPNLRWPAMLEKPMLGIERFVNRVEGMPLIKPLFVYYIYLGRKEPANRLSLDEINYA